MFKIFNRHQHKFVDKNLFYSTDKDVDCSKISDFGFTRTYRVRAVQIQECECGKTRKTVILDKTFFQDNPFDKDKYLRTVRELIINGYKESNLI